MLANLIALMMARLPIDNEEGQGMAEYGLILALIAVVVIIALTTLGTTISGKFDEVVGGLTAGG